MVETINNFCDWFVLGVRSGREYALKEFIEERATEKLKMIIFSRELIFSRNNKEIKVLTPLFPGYIFVHKKVPEVIETIKKNCINEFVKPICFKCTSEKCTSCYNRYSPCMVSENEMEALLSSTDVSGTIGVSYGLRQGASIKIIHGPLKFLNNQILWINPKKKKVCVEIDLFKQKIKINLGFSLLDDYESEKAG